MSSGSDSWAVEQGWISITPLGLRSDITFSQVSHITRSSNMSAPGNLTVSTEYHIVPMLGTRPKAPQEAFGSVRVLLAALQHFNKFCAVLCCAVMHAYSSEASSVHD